MKKIIYSLLLFASVATFTGCEEAGYEGLIPQEYNKILYLKNNGQKDIALFNDGKKVNYSITVVKTGSDPSATALVNLSPLTQAEIDNDIRYKGNNYIVLNKDCYSFRSKDISFGSSDSYKIEDFTLDPEQIINQMEAEATPNSIFILPIRLSSKTDSVNYEQRDLILKPTVKQLSIKFEKTTTNIDLGVNKDNEIVTEMKVTMASGIINQWDFTAGMTVSTDQAEVDAYNETNGTSYKAIPTGSFITPEDLIFSLGISESVGVLVVDRSKLKKGNTYLVPIKLEQSDITTITSDPKKHYVILKYMFDMVNDKIALTADMLSDPFNCTKEGSLGDLVNDKLDDHWGTKYGEACGTPEYGQPFDVHIGKSVQSIMFKYVTRHNNDNGTPTVIKIFTSADNGQTWNSEPLATLTKDGNGLPQTAKKEFVSATYSSEQPFNCIRFSIMESKLGICDGQHKTSDNAYWVSTAVTEFSLWGM